MIYYNIAKHTLETTDGLVVANLTDGCTSDMAYALQDALQECGSATLGNVAKVRASLHKLAHSQAPERQDDFQLSLA